MCIGCYNEYRNAHPGYEPIKEEMAIIAMHIAVLCSNDRPSSTFHIVIDDWNLEDEHLNWCLDQGLSVVEQNIALSMLDLSLSQRYEIMRLVEIYEYL